MTISRDDLAADRALRDSARALVDTDVANLKSDLSARSVGERAKDRVAVAATDIYEEARDLVTENKGVVAAIVGAIALWFLWGPLRDLLFGGDDDYD